MQKELNGAEVVKAIIKKNPMFIWLETDLPNNPTVAEVREIMQKFGYDNAFEAAKKSCLIIRIILNKSLNLYK
jgi:hypothetical protein